MVVSNSSPPPVVFGDLKTPRPNVRKNPTRHPHPATPSRMQVKYLFWGAKKSSKNWGTQPNNDHVLNLETKRCFLVPSLKLTANTPLKIGHSKKGNESSFTIHELRCELLVSWRVVSLGSCETSPKNTLWNCSWKTYCFAQNLCIFPFKQNVSCAV